jgi:hypothetical protein
MQDQNNSSVSGKILAKGMEIQAQSKQQHYPGRRRSSKMVGWVTLIAILAAIAWVVWGWREPV